jgi:hypothetical protein
LDPALLDSLLLIGAGGAQINVRYDCGAVHVMDPAWTCAADLNLDGLVNVLDFVALQQAGVAGDPLADIDGDGQFHWYADVMAYKLLFAAGCEKTLDFRVAGGASEGGRGVDRVGPRRVTGRAAHSPSWRRNEARSRLLGLRSPSARRVRPHGRGRSG